MSNVFKSNNKYPSIPAIGQDIKSHTAALNAIMEAIAIHERRTKDLDNSFVRVKELVDLGLITLAGGDFNVIGVDLGSIAGVGDLTGASEGDLLRFVGGVWVNSQLNAGDILESFVTQHEAALDIDWSQLTSVPSTFPSEDPNYVTQTITEKFWVAGDFVRGHNIIGVRYSGTAIVYLPHDLPVEYIVVVKDEVGFGDVTVRIY